MYTISNRRLRSSGLVLLPFLSGLLVAALHGQTLYNFGNPTADEQVYIELVNRARANPAAEGARLAATTDPDVLGAYSHFNVDLTMMQTEFSALSALPPLAPNANLTTAARGHSAWMLANDTQSHNETNPSNTSSSRMLAAGYDYYTVGESIYASARNAWHGHAGFQVDWGAGGAGGMQLGRGHRANTHSASFREIGVGVTFGSDENVGPQQVTQDFGARSPSPSFGTGVAYYDLNANNFYDAGEGISGLTVNVAGTSNYCITAAGGGWTVPIPTSSATRAVSFTGLGMNQAVNLVVPASQNAKADLKLNYSPPTITSSATAYTGVAHSLAFTAVAGATGYQWKRWDINDAADENCETTANITSSTSGSYGVLNTNVQQQGTASFHLENSTGTSQSIELGSLYFGHASPSISFESRIRTSSASEHFKVQVKEEGSTVWQDVYDQTGGTPENTFSLRNATLTGMSGKLFHVRFVLSFVSGSYWPYSADTYGWFIDAISFTNVSTLTNLSSQLLTGTSGSFTPSSDSYLMAVAPVISTLEFPASTQILTSPEIVVEEPVGIVLNSSSSTLTFGNSNLGTPVVKTFTVRNTGTANLSGLAVSCSGTHASDFTLGALGATTLAPEASTTFTVTFTPAAAGSRSAALEIASNDASENPFVINLGGTGVVIPAPEIVVEEPVGANRLDGAAALDFGYSSIGTPVIKTVTVRNTGTLDLTGLAVTRSGTNTSDFVLSALGATTLAAGAETTFTVTFTPAAAGSRSAALQIASNDSDENPFDITLGGTGVVGLLAPEIVVEEPLDTVLVDGAAALAFGNSNIGTPIIKTVTIRNTGTADLTGLAVSNSGTNASDFAVSALGSTTLAPGADTSFTMTFTPAAAGSRSASLQIASNDADENPFDITLDGTGVVRPEPEIVVEEPVGTDLVDGSASMSFGDSNIGTPVIKTVTVRNTGTADLTSLVVSFSGAHASDFAVSALETTTLAPDANTTFTVTFTPAAAGSRSASLQIGSNDADENPFDITLSGTGIAVDPFDIAFVGTPYDLRVGNKVSFDLKRFLTTGETLKLGGKIPTGLKYNATTGLLTGTISGKPGTYVASIQVLLGKTVVRTIPLTITVLEFPPTLIGNFHFLMEDSGSVPIGVCKITITKANGWSATLESAGATKKRSAKGPFILAEGAPIAPITALFPAIAATSSVPGVPAVNVSISIDGSTPTITGTYNGGTLRGFRLAKVGEFPPATVAYSLVLDAGDHDGHDIPAGYGWMKGKVSNKGIGTFKGLLGDGTAASITLGLSAFGQAVLWSQPYKNKSSYIGGIVTLGNLGQTTLGVAPFTDEVWWTKTADLTTLSYPNGFPGMPVIIRTSRWTAPASATALGSELGWSDNRAASVTIEGGGLSNEEQQTTIASLPTEFTLDDKFALITSLPVVTSLPVSPPLVVWKGKVSKTDGAISGTLTLPVGFSSEFPSGTATASGVLVQDQWGAITGCGQIKVPAADPKGSFKTATIELGQ